MKTVFNILIFLALFAFTAEIASVLWEKTQVESLAETDSDEDPDSDVPDGEEEEEEDFRTKGWFFAGMELIELEWITATDRTDFAEPDRFTALHQTKPPYSPPELV